MSERIQNNELSAEIPAELHDWYYEEIDALLAESRKAINKDVYPFKGKRNGYALPLVINLVIAFFMTIILITAVIVLNRHEKDIISDYTYFLSVEGRILSKYKLETEKKLKALNTQISEVEGRLKGVTDEKNRLLGEMDEKIKAEKKRLGAEMKELLEAERLVLREQGLSKKDIEDKISQLKAEKTREALEREAELKEQLEQEYARKQEENLARLNELEMILARSREERAKLDTELEQTNDKLKDLNGSDNVPETAAHNVTDSTNTDVSDSEDGRMAIDQINAMYKSINTAIAVGNIDAAEKSVHDLSNFLAMDKIASLEAINSRAYGDREIIDSLEKLIILMRENKNSTAALPAESGIPQEIQDRINRLDKQYLALKNAEKNMQSYFSGNRIKPEDSNLVKYLEIKLAVKEILSTEPVVSAHPGLAEKLEEYYAVLSREKQTAGQLLALRRMADLFELIENSGEKIPSSWKSIDNEEVRYNLIQLIREIKGLFR